MNGRIRSFSVPLVSHSQTLDVVMCLTSSIKGQRSHQSIFQVVVARLNETHTRNGETDAGYLQLFRLRKYFANSG